MTAVVLFAYGAAAIAVTYAWCRSAARRNADPAPDLVFDQLDQELTAFDHKIQGLYVKEGEQ